jgi:hypothetical protein
MRAVRGGYAGCDAPRLLGSRPPKRGREQPSRTPTVNSSAGSRGSHHQRHRSIHDSRVTWTPGQEVARGPIHWDLRRSFQDGETPTSIFGWRLAGVTGLRRKTTALPRAATGRHPRMPRDDWWSQGRGSRSSPGTASGTPSDHRAPGASATTGTIRCPLVSIAATSVGNPGDAHVSDQRTARLFFVT